MNAPVIKRREGAVLTLGIDRPEDLNRINRAAMQGLSDAFDEADADSQVRVIVLTGSRQSFCAGGRIDGHPGGTVSQQLGFTQAFCALQERMGRVRAPIIAAVEGNCVAGGMSLLAACDLAIAADDVQFSYPEINYGLFPVLAMAVAVPILAPKTALDLFYSGRTFGAEEALRLQLVNRIVPHGSFWEAVGTYADTLAGKNAFALGLGRKGFYAMQGMTPAARLEYAQTLLTTMINSPEAGAVPKTHGR